MRVFYRKDIVISPTKKCWAIFDILEEIVNKIAIKVILRDGENFYRKTIISLYVFGDEDAEILEKQEF